MKSNNNLQNLLDKYLKLIVLFKNKYGESYSSFWIDEVFENQGNAEVVFEKFQKVLKLFSEKSKEYPYNDLIWGNLKENMAIELTPLNETPEDIFEAYTLIAKKLKEDGYSECPGQPMSEEVVDILKAMIPLTLNH